MNAILQAQLEQPSVTPIARDTSKPKNGFTFVLTVILMISLLGNIYFFIQLNGVGPFGKLQNCRVPVEQTETQPTTNISETPGSETAASPDVDEMQGWKTLKTDYFQVQYPSDIKVENIDDSTTRLQKIGPTQKENTELYDGININFTTIKDFRTAEQYAKTSVEKIKDQQIGEVVKEVTPITLGRHTGYTYTASGLGVHRFYIFKFNNKDGLLLEVIDSTNDPSNQGYNLQAQKILDTLELY